MTAEQDRQIADMLKADKSAVEIMEAMGLPLLSMEEIKSTVALPL